jgi:putative hydrolase of the HAD superfamily
LITKGDLLDQEQKLARSGLGDYFAAVEIVSDKTAQTYRRIFAAELARGEETVMIGNSLRSDIIPAIEAGLWGIHIPYHLTWAHEHAETPAEMPRFVELKSIDAFPAWLESRSI